MSRRFKRLIYRARGDERGTEHGDKVIRSSETFRGDLPRGVAAEPETFNSDEAAARFFLEGLLLEDESDAMRSLVGEDQGQKVPDFEKVAENDLPAVGTRLVKFEQRRESIPIFGAEAGVEISTDRDLVSAIGRLASIPERSKTPSLSWEEATQEVREYTGAEFEDSEVPLPTLTYFQDDTADDEQKAWHLAWFLTDVPAVPPDVADDGGVIGHGLGASPRDLHLVNYLVDAHEGEVLYYYPSAPTLAIPVLCKGVDESGVEQEFYGDRVEGIIRMHDPLKHTKSYDLNYGDVVDSSFPAELIEVPEQSEGSASPAAVTAHVNAGRVQNFYKAVLQRNGIDDQGMDLISIVNCTYKANSSNKVWKNALWHKRKMWYGQEDEGGELASMSRHLDVIAHELTHGVVEFTSKLKYRDESGALNESFADIFGVIVSNWYLADEPEDVSTWTWEIAPDHRGGLPLRDLSDPTRTDDPAHWDDRYVGPKDYGGVHTNSGIPNKAAYKVLTSRDPGGGAEFGVQDVSVLFYVTLSMLPSQATFLDVRTTLLNVAAEFYSGSEAEEGDRKLAAIEAAYDSVGIK